MLLVISAARLPDVAGQSFGPGFFPGLIGKGLVAAGLFLAVRAFMDQRATPSAASHGKSAWLGAAFIVAMLIVYVVLSDRLGFHLTAIGCVAPIMWLFTRKPVASLVITTIGTVCVHAAFYGLFRVPLPWGVLQPFAW